MTKKADSQKESLERLMNRCVCESCHGLRLKPEALGVTVGGKNIIELCSFSVNETIEFFKNIQFTETEKQIAEQILKEINNRLLFLTLYQSIM